MGVAAVKSYTEHEQAVNSMAAATGAAGEELDNLQGAMEAVYKNNFGENLQDAADAVATVDRNLKNISPDEIQEATEAAWRSGTHSSTAWRKAHAPRRPLQRISADPQKRRSA